LFGFPAPFPVAHLPLLFLAGGMIETFGGLLLLIGLFTRSLHRNVDSPITRH
jgi:uncharacterized membrane protein YphA (DoxX/SURF4 family)